MKRNLTIRHGALDGVEVFLSVARLQSFRQASARLGITPSAVSQAVRALEARLGVALFTRTTRSVGLTEAGRRFFERGAPAFDDLIAASEAARDLGARPAGLLRIAVPRAAAPLIIEPMIASFCEAYPEIEIEIAASEQLIDLAAEGFDAGIRFSHMIAPDMVVVRLTAAFPFAVVGSGEYFDKRKHPQRIEELAGHACLRLRRSNGSLAPWTFADGNKTIEAVVSGPLIAHDYPTLLGAALRGVGLAQVPAPLAAAPVAEGLLHRVLTPYEHLTSGVFLYYPSRRQVLPKLRAFIDHAKRFAPSMDRHDSEHGELDEKANGLRRQASASARRSEEIAQEKLSEKTGRRSTRHRD